MTKTHGLTESRVYKIWARMHSRCRNRKDSTYFRYGARNIRVCERWRKFENFLEDMGHPPEGTSLDRINNDGNYEPGNCRWATLIQQANNTRLNKRLTYKGEVLTLAEIARRSGVPYKRLGRRLREGWPIEAATSMPKQPARRRFKNCKDYEAFEQ